MGKTKKEKENVSDMQNVRVKRGIWLRILKYFKPFIIGVAITGLLAVAVSAADLINPYISKLVIDEYITNQSESLNIFILGGLYMLVVLFAAVCQYAQSFMLNRVGQKIIHNIRMDVFTHIQKMNFKFFDKNAAGSILTRATNDVEALSELYGGVIVNLFRDVITLVGIIAVMVGLNAQMALAAFSILPFIILATFLYNSKFKKNFRIIRKLLGQINAFFAENISGMKLVQIFAREKEKYGEFKKLNDDYNKANKIAVMMNALFRPASELINNLAITILIWFTARGIIGGTIEIGMLYAFITYSKKFFNPISNIADNFTTIQTASVSAERIFELMDDRENEEDLNAGDYTEEIKGRVEFKNVWFAYGNNENGEPHWVLRDVSFTLEAGETTAFVGATGSGKSTIINLIGRFYDIQKGEILIDSVNINRFPKAYLRSRLTVVLQDIFLFAGDIKSNIRLNNAEITDQMVKESAEFVNASEFIEELPGGYNEVVRERGATLSAGERQLLSFARAVAFDPKILILDEATASINTETEMLIQSSLQKMAHNRTTIVIAHRLSTIVNAHKIIVIHKGKIREIGRHEELLANNGIYKRLYEIQFAEYDKAN